MTLLVKPNTAQGKAAVTSNATIWRRLLVSRYLVLELESREEKKDWRFFRVRVGLIFFRQASLPCFAQMLWLIFFHLATGGAQDKQTPGSVPHYVR
jgi:hypothetical protein